MNVFLLVLPLSIVALAGWIIIATGHTKGLTDLSVLVGSLATLVTALSSWR